MAVCTAKHVPTSACLHLRMLANRWSQCYPHFSLSSPMPPPVHSTLHTAKRDRFLSASEEAKYRKRAFQGRMSEIPYEEDGDY